MEKPAQRIAEKSAGPSTAKKAKPKTYAPAAKTTAKKPAPEKKPAPSTGDKVARAAGKQLSGFGKMFGDFKDEFNKASK